MLAKTITVSLLSLGALVAAVPVDTETPGAPADVDGTAAPAAVAAAPPQGPRREGPRPGQFRGEPRPFRGDRPGFGYGGPGWGGPGPYPVVVPVPVGPVGPGAPAGSLELYCESLNIPAYQLPRDCALFCRDTARGPWWC